MRSKLFMGNSTKVSILSENRPFASNLFRWIIKTGGRRANDNFFDARRLTLHWGQSLIVRMSIPSSKLSIAHTPCIIFLQHLFIEECVQTMLYRHLAIPRVRDRKLQDRKHIVGGRCLKISGQIDACSLFYFALTLRHVKHSNLFLNCPWKKSTTKLSLRDLHVRHSLSLAICGGSRSSSASSSGVVVKFGFARMRLRSSWIPSIRKLKNSCESC